MRSPRPTGPEELERAPACHVLSPLYCHLRTRTRPQTRSASCPTVTFVSVSAPRTLGSHACRLHGMTRCALNLAKRIWSLDPLVDPGQAVNHGRCTSGTAVASHRVDLACRVQSNVLLQRASQRKPARRRALSSDLFMTLFPSLSQALLQPHTSASRIPSAGDWVSGAGFLAVLGDVLEEAAQRVPVVDQPLAVSGQVAVDARFQLRHAELVGVCCEGRPVERRCSEDVVLVSLLPSGAPCVGGESGCGLAVPACLAGGRVRPRSLIPSLP